MKRTNQKLTFQKKSFRVLAPGELARVQGGGSESDPTKGEMELRGEMELHGER